MEPPGFLDCVRSGRINIVTGIIISLVDKTVKVETEGQALLTIDADNILQATGYTLVSKRPDVKKLCSPVKKNTFIGASFLIRRNVTDTPSSSTRRSNSEQNRSPLYSALSSYCPPRYD